ncbi:type VI secretion system baseplate subunit TssE [Campylobacter lari]|nr:type VI secretion system baseplate subunit TssE [Campylobacter lari]HEF1623561.1 GPW/gp25 family protein [Campylobacter lari]
MSLLDKIIHSLDEQYKNIPFYQNEFQEIKNNIQVLLNAKLDDCLSVEDFGLSSMENLNLSSTELCLNMAKEIHKLISKYEKRIVINSITYNDSLKPWQLSFLLKCVFCNDNFKEFAIEIIFKNNRYCEVI